MKKHDEYTATEPLYCTIAATGDYWCIYHKPTAKISRSHCQGYSIDTFKEVPDNIPVIDWRTADTSKIVSFIMKYDCKEETTLHVYGNYIPLADYLKKAEEIGATVTTVGGLRS